MSNETTAEAEISAHRIPIIAVMLGGAFLVIIVLLVMVRRVIQFSGTNILMPIMMTVMMLIFPREQRGFAMGMAGLVIGFAPGIGPTLSGWIIDIFPLRSLFLIVLPLAII